MSKDPLPPIKPKLRCAIYCRKSSEEGLDQQFNSLHAQREACEAYVKSQAAEGWHLVADHYDDGGFSGGNLERPGLKRLLGDIEAGRIDIVVTYKIDRLSRSLMDFTKLVEVFDRNRVTFCSITQSFNTTSSMGRLTLNILLSFAQFEREIIGERIRDKVAASRKKGIWMGGYVPMGYIVKDRKLVINEPEATLVHSVFLRFAKLGSVTKLVRELATENVRNRYGKLIDKGALYKLINNRVYVGDAVHKGTAYPGEHKAIIARDLWDEVHGILKVSPRKRAAHSRVQSPAILKGLIFGPDGVPMTPTHTRKRGRLYRYYVATNAIRSGVPTTCPIRRIPAAEIEGAVIEQIKKLVRSPEIIVATWRATKRHIGRLTERQVQDRLQNFFEVWSQLFPAEQARIVQLLVARIQVSTTGAAITLRTDGLATLMHDLGANGEEKAA